jgi:hypothetical protein
MGRHLQEPGHGKWLTQWGALRAKVVVCAWNCSHREREMRLLADFQSRESPCWGTVDHWLCQEVALTIISHYTGAMMEQDWQNILGRGAASVLWHLCAIVPFLPSFPPSQMDSRRGGKRRGVLSSVKWSLNRQWVLSLSLSSFCET